MPNKTDIRRTAILDKKKNVKDEQLEKISGGFDDYNYCEWSPIELHEW